MQYAMKTYYRSSMYQYVMTVGHFKLQLKTKYLLSNLYIYKINIRSASTSVSYMLRDIPISWYEDSVYIAENIRNVYDSKIKVLVERVPSIT